MILLSNLVSEDPTITWQAIRSLFTSPVVPQFVVNTLKIKPQHHIFPILS